MKDFRLLKDINKLSQEERLIISKSRLERALKEKIQIELSLKELIETITYLEKKMESLSRNETKNSIEEIKKRVTIRRQSYDRVKVNLYLAASFRSGLESLNATKKPLAQLIRSLLKQYLDESNNTLLPQHLEAYTKYEEKNRETRKTFIVGIDREAFNTLGNISEETGRDIREIVESIIYMHTNKG